MRVLLDGPSSDYLQVFRARLFFVLNTAIESPASFGDRGSERGVARNSLNRGE
jgi:hypothetical protein